MDFLSLFTVPFAYIMKGCMFLFNNYALALIGYALITKIIVFPISMKQQKSQLGMLRLRPYQDELKKRYGNNQERYNQELQKLYQREGYNPMSSCLPLMIQLPLILLIYNIVRHPLTYVYYGEVTTKSSAEKVYQLALQLKETLPEKIASVVDKIQAGTDAATKISGYEQEIYNAASKADLINIPGDTFFGLFSFASTPKEDLWSWMILIPILAAVTGYLTSWVSQKLNKATQDPAMQQGCAGNSMTYMMPLLSLWICYTLNCALGWYWIVSNVLMIGQSYLLHKMYNPDKVLAEAEAGMRKEKETKKVERSAVAAKKAAAIAATRNKKKK